MSTVPARIMRELSAKLDPPGGIGIQTWKELATELMDKKSHHEISYLDKNIQPGLEFLKKLSHEYPEVTVIEFQKVCERGVRNDIVNHFSKMDKTMLLSKLELGAKQEIASFLNLETPGSNNWKWFCDEYKFDKTVIEIIENSSTAQNKDICPTERLFARLRQIKPDMTVETVIKACKEIGREDVVTILKNFLISQPSKK